MPHMHNQNLSPYWMPFTANRQFKAQPRLMASADGMYYRDVAGRDAGLRAALSDEPSGCI